MKIIKAILENVPGHASLRHVYFDGSDVAAVFDNAPGKTMVRLKSANIEIWLAESAEAILRQLGWETQQ